MRRLTRAGSLRAEVAEEGELWSARAKDWAQVQERFLDPCYLRVLDLTGPGPGSKVLDVGCGAGRFLELAARRGSAVSGLDAAPGMLEIARARVPDGDFRVGDMEQLPYPNRSFHIVTGFNSFSHADDPVRALTEAGRVAVAGGRVAITVWGPRRPGAASCLFLHVLQSLWDADQAAVEKKPAGPTQAGDHVHSIDEDDDLRRLAGEAGLSPESSGDVECLFDYPDEGTFSRGIMAPGPFVEASRRLGDEKVRKAIVEAFEHFRTETGGYRFTNDFRYLICTV